MNDNELISALIDLRDYLEFITEDRYVDILNLAIERIKPPADTVPIRLAVAVGDGAELVMFVNCEYSGKEEMAIVRQECLDSCREIIAEAIIIANIPRRIIPTVTATVQPIPGDSQ